MKRPIYFYLYVLIIVHGLFAFTYAPTFNQLEFPYNAAEKVKIYSYQSQYEVVLLDDEEKEEPTPTKSPEAVLDILELSIKRSTIKDEITLSDDQKSELFSILTAPIPARAEVAFCYDPHHLIVFYDAADKPYAYIELCLECGVKKTSTEFHVAFSLENSQQIADAFTRFGTEYLGPTR